MEDYYCATCAMLLDPTRPEFPGQIVVIWFEDEPYCSQGCASNSVAS